ncbi:MAG TPA: biotin--[acetyl-CoA-carboxylase] ligase [Aliiroseovarius sp.]|nr:biotin--[acetyl-CoA-carboxylase] ligase [Aliiroseovarius sp.]
MSTWPAGYDLIERDEVDSTLSEAARHTMRGPTWIFAHRQTAARGRRGRPWIQPEGNFSATLVLPDAGPPEHAALRSFVASLALYDALDGYGGALALKWPNDVLLNGGKVAGILLESLPGAALAIGIGVNLRAAPDLAEVEAGAVPPVSLAGECKLQVTPRDFLTRLAGAFAVMETQFNRFGFAPIRTAWLEHAARLGACIRVRLPNEEFEGVFKDVDASGRLVLSTPHGIRQVAAGDVFF